MKADVTQSVPPFNAPSEVWSEFYDELRSNINKKVAKSLWLAAWVKRGNSNANTRDLREKMAKEGIKLSKSSWDSVVDLGGGISDTFGDIFKVGKVAGIAIGVIIIGGAAMIIFNIAKNPIDAAKVALSARTGGLGGK